MAIEDGNQVLPTNVFEGFVDDDDSDSLSAIDNDDDNLDDEGADIIADTINKSDDNLNDDKSDDLEDADNLTANAEEVTDTPASDTPASDTPTADTPAADTPTADTPAADTDIVNVEDDDFIPEVEDEDAIPLAAGEEAKVLTKREKFDRYSRSVQRRINKGTKQREELREENRILHDRIANIENSMVQTQANNDAAILDNRLRNATAIKQNLLEEGEYARAAEADNDIIEMRIRKNNMDTQAAQRGQGTQNQPSTQGYVAPTYPNDSQSGQPGQSGQPVQSGQPGQPVQSGQPGQPGQERVPAAQTQWIQNNQRFGREPGYTAFVNENYDRMIAQGYNPDDPTMYTELDKRVGNTAPAAQTPAAQTPAAQTPAAQTPAAQTPAAQTPAARPRTEKAPPPNNGQQAQTPAKPGGLTEADKINMAGWGLDPKNIKERKEWLQNKRA